MQIFAASIFVLELYADLDRDTFSLSYVHTKQDSQKPRVYGKKPTPS
jgi:hypothetical protein